MYSLQPTKLNKPGNKVCNKVSKVFASEQQQSWHYPILVLCSLSGMQGSWALMVSLSFQTHHQILLDLLQQLTLLCTMKSSPQPGSLESLTSGQALSTCLLIMPYFTLCVPPVSASQLVCVDFSNPFTTRTHLMTYSYL